MHPSRARSPGGDDEPVDLKDDPASDSGPWRSMERVDRWMRVRQGQRREAGSRTASGPGGGCTGEMRPASPDELVCLIMVKRTDDPMFYISEGAGEYRSPSWSPFYRPFSTTIRSDERFSERFPGLTPLPSGYLTVKSLSSSSFTFTGRFVTTSRT